MRVHLPASAFKFLVFALVCLVLLVALAQRIGDVSLFSSRHTIYAQLADVTGLSGGDDVDIAGVPVGQVASIAVQRGHALIAMSIDNDVALHRSTDVGLRWHNVLGQKVVYLYPAATGAILSPDATIPLSHDVSDASVDAFLNSLGPFLTSLNTKEANEFVENVSGALEGDTAEVDQLIDNGAKVSATVGALDVQVGSVIDNLDQVLSAIAARSGDVTSLIDNLQTVAQSLSSHNSLLDEVVGNLGKVAGDLANLIGANRSTLDSTIADLASTTQTIVAHQNELAQSLSTLGSGLAPYVEISSWGQWFEIQTVYTCLANQTVCTYYQPLDAPGGSGPGGGSPLPAPLQSIYGSLPSPSGSSEAGVTSLAQSSIPLDLGAVGGLLGSNVGSPSEVGGQ